MSPDLLFPIGVFLGSIVGGVSAHLYLRRSPSANETQAPPPDVESAVRAIRTGQVTERAVETILDEVKRRTADRFVAARNWDEVLQLKGVLVGAGLVLELLEFDGRSAVEHANDRKEKKS